MVETKPRKTEAVTPEQCIAARRLLGWSQAELSRALGVGQDRISLVEHTGHLSAQKRGQADRVADLRTVFEQAGVTFTKGEEPGVKLRKAES